MHTDERERERERKRERGLHKGFCTSPTNLLATLSIERSWAHTSPSSPSFSFSRCSHCHSWSSCSRMDPEAARAPGEDVRVWGGEG